MNANTPDAHESTDIEPRTRRALEESLTVLTPRGTPVTDGDRTIVSVVSHSGTEYRVDVREGRCTCADHKHRDADCKHRRRARFALGRETVPAATLAAVDADPNLGANAPGPAVATADGSGVVEAGDDAELVGTDDGRPADCDCIPADGQHGTPLACWPCRREGHQDVNPDADTEAGDE